MKKAPPKRSVWSSLKRFIFSSKEAWVITGETVVGLILCFTSLVTFFYFTQDMLAQEFHAFDVEFSRGVYYLRTPELTYLMFNITSLGSAVTIVAMSLIGIIFLIKDHKKEAILFSLALIMGTLLNGFLKMIIHRQGPELEPLIVEKMSSFPSGHAMNVFIFFALLSYFSHHFFRNKLITFMITLLSVVTIILVGFSRIYLGVHYFSDVLAGYLAGFWWFVTVLLIDRTLIFYRLFRKSE